ncbi:MAG TPA: molybdopterin dinucleotide binding domain-containing protein, partial [Chloroflexia bacterium]
EDAIPMPGATSYKQLRVNGLQWPCFAADQPDSPVLYAGGKLPRPAQIAAAPALGGGAAPADGTLLMIAGFSLFPFRTGTQSRHSKSLAKVQPHSRLHLHPADAQRLGLRDVEQVRVSAATAPRNGHGSGDLSELNTRPVDAITLVSDAVPQGTAFLGLTMAQAGRSPLARQALAAQTGGAKAVAIRVEPLYGVPTGDATIGPGPATGNVVDRANATLPPA